MAGFRNVVPPLGVYDPGVVAADGGFQGIVPSVRLGGGAPVPGVRAAGFGTPLGVLLVRSTRTAYGFRTLIPGVPISAKIGNRGRHDPGFHKAWFPSRYEIRDLEELELFMMAIAAIEDSYEIDGEIEYEIAPNRRPDK